MLEENEGRSGVAGPTFMFQRSIPPDQVWNPETSLVSRLAPSRSSVAEAAMSSVEALCCSAAAATSWLEEA